MLITACAFKHSAKRVPKKKKKVYIYLSTSSSPSCTISKIHTGFTITLTSPFFSK